jgi:hypothetical protein
VSLSGPSLDLIAPIRPLQLCADGGYQLRFWSLGGTPNYGPRQQYTGGCMDDEPEPTAKAFYDMFDVAQKPLHDQTKVSQLDAIGHENHWFLKLGGGAVLLLWG